MLSRFSLEGLAISDFLQSPGHSVRRHHHANAIISAVMKGSASEQFARREYTLPCGSVLTKPAEEAHAHRYGNRGARVLTIEIAPAKQLALGLQDALARVQLVSSPFVANLIASMRHELANADASSELILEGLLLQLIGLLGRDARSKAVPGDPVVSLVTEFLHENFRRRLTIVDIARQFNVSPQRLAACFRARFGRSVGRYQRQLRIQCALGKLQSTEISLTDIAIEAGYFDQSHFTHAIKANTGLTPAAIRAKKLKLTKTGLLQDA